MNRGINVVLLAGLSLAAVLFMTKPAFAGPTGWTAMGTIDAGTYQRKTGDSTFTKNTTSGNGFVTIWKNDSTGGLVPTSNFGATDPAGGDFGTAVPPSAEVDAAEGVEDAEVGVEGAEGEGEGMDGGMTGNADGAGYSDNGESDFENGGTSDTNDDQDNDSDNSSTSSDNSDSGGQDDGDTGDDDGAGDDGDGGCTDCGDKGFEDPDDLWWKGAKNSKGSIYEYTPPDVGKGRVNRGTIHEYTPPEGVKQNIIHGSNGQTVMVAPSDGDWSNQARRSVFAR